MTILNMTVSGYIKKGEVKQMGKNTYGFASLCRKNYKSKESEEPDSFTWVNVKVRDPKDFQKFDVGNYITATGKVTLRSYVGKDGKKGHSLELECSSFDVETIEPGERSTEPTPQKRKPAPTSIDDDNSSPPF